jgi:hypothetical protein
LIDGFIFTELPDPEKDTCSCGWACGARSLWRPQQKLPLYERRPLLETFP